MARIDELDPIASISGTDEIIVDDGTETQRGTVSQVTAGLTYASEAQARAGVATGVVMDPLQVANAIDELASVTEAGANTFTGSNTFNGAFAQNGLQSETLAATTNDLALDATANSLEIDLTGDQTLNGLTGGAEGREIRLRNIDTSETLIISHDASGSTTTNRFALPADQSFSVLPGQSVVLRYSSSRWRLIAQTYSVGTDAGDLVQVGAGGTLPALSGVNLTGISKIINDIVYFTSSDTVVVPAGVTLSEMIVTGGGASGSSGGSQMGLSGGAGATVIAKKAVVAGETLTVTVGAGGVSGATSSAGSNSSVSGGFGTLTGAGASAGASGASATGGDLNIDGGDGHASLASGNETYGIGGASYWGGGGQDGTSGGTGRAYGSGGGAATSGNGGAGAQGAVVIRWM